MEMEQSQCDVAQQLAHISVKIGDAENAIQLQQRLLEDRDAFAEATEAKLEGRSNELSRRLEVLDEMSVTLPFSPHRQVGLVARALRSPRCLGFSRDAPASQALQPIFADLRTCQEEEIQLAHDRCEVSASELLGEKAECQRRLERNEEAIGRATQQEVAELSRRRGQLWEMHEVSLNEQLAARQASLCNIRAETSKAEDAYQRLRQALFVEHAEAEKQHAELMEEQTLQRRRFVAAAQHNSRAGLASASAGRSHVVPMLAFPEAEEARNALSCGAIAAAGAGTGSAGGSARRVPVASGCRGGSGSIAERAAGALRSTPQLTPRQQRTSPRSTPQLTNFTTPRLTDRNRHSSTGC